MSDVKEARRDEAYAQCEYSFRDGYTSAFVNATKEQEVLAYQSWCKSGKATGAEPDLKTAFYDGFLYGRRARNTWIENLDEPLVTSDPSVKQPGIRHHRCYGLNTSFEEPDVSISSILKERGNNYGDFRDGCAMLTSVMSNFDTTPQWKTCAPYLKEGVRMIVNKLCRAFTGKPTYVDNFTDICGYSKLIEERLRYDNKEDSDESER